MLQLSQTSSPMHVWAEKYNEQGQAAFIGEGDLKPAISFSLQMKSTTAKKVGVSAKFTKETLQIFPVHGGTSDGCGRCYRYQGRGKAPQWRRYWRRSFSVIPQATTYVLTTIKTKNANNFDAIKAAFTQLTTLNYR